MKVEFEDKGKILTEFKALANSPFFERDKVPSIEADAIVLKTMLEIRDLLIFIYHEISGKVDMSGRKPS